MYDRGLVITMVKSVVVSILRSNKSAHLEEYQLQFAAWKIAMTKYTDQINTWAQGGGDQENRPKEPPKPQDFSKEYDDLMKRIDAHCLMNIDLDDDTQEQVIFNKFKWSDRFMGTSMLYSVGSASQEA